METKMNLYDVHGEAIIPLSLSIEFGQVQDRRLLILIAYCRYILEFCSYAYTNRLNCEQLNYGYSSKRNVWLITTHLLTSTYQK